MVELGFFPHVLQQAASFIRSRCKVLSLPDHEQAVDGCPIYQFLKLYREDRNAENILKYQFWNEAGDNYGLTTWTVWKVILERMAREEFGSEANLFMEVASFLAPDEIPIFIFYKETQNQSQNEKILKAIQALIKCSVLKLVDRERKLVSLHRLSQKVKRVELGHKGLLVIKSAILLLKPHLDLGTKFDGKQVQKARLVASHAVQLCHHIVSGEHLKHHADFGDFFLIVLSALTTLGLLGQAIDFGQKFSPIIQKEFGDSELSFAMKDGLGLACLYKMELSMARDIYINQDFHLLSKSLLGPKHPRTLSIACNKATTVLRIAKFQESLDLFNSAHYLCADSGALETLKLRAGIALAQKCLGLYEKARKGFKEVRKIIEEVQPDNETFIMQLKFELGLVYIFINKSAKAAKLLLEYAKGSRSRFGLGHFQTLRGYIKYSEALVAMGSYSEADVVIDGIYEIAKIEFGPKASQVFQLMENRVKTKIGLGEWGLEKLREHHEKLRELKIEELKFPENGVGVIHEEKNIGRILYEQGNYKEANEILGKVKRKQIMRWTPEHPDVKITEDLIKKCTEALGTMNLEKSPPVPSLTVEDSEFGDGFVLISGVDTLEELEETIQLGELGGDGNTVVGKAIRLPGKYIYGGLILSYF